MYPIKGVLGIKKTHAPAVHIHAVGGLESIVFVPWEEVV